MARKNRVLAPGWKYIPERWRFPNFYLPCSGFKVCNFDRKTAEKKCLAWANLKLEKAILGRVFSPFLLRTVDGKREIG